MQKDIRIGISVLTIMVLVLSSLTPVMGYQIIQSSHPYRIVNQLQQIQSSNSECDCKNEKTTLWHPCICLLLLPIFIILFIMSHMFGVDMLFIIALQRLQEIGVFLNCFWSLIPVP